MWETWEHYCISYVGWFGASIVGLNLFLGINNLNIFPCHRTRNELRPVGNYQINWLFLYPSYRGHSVDSQIIANLRKLSAKLSCPNEPFQILPDTVAFYMAVVTLLQTNSNKHKLDVENQPFVDHLSSGIKRPSVFQNLVGLPQGISMTNGCEGLKADNLTADKIAKSPHGSSTFQKRGTPKE